MKKIITLTLVTFFIIASWSEHAYSQLSVDAGADTTICAGAAASLTATPSLGVPPYSFLWSTGETLQSIAH